EKTNKTFNIESKTQTDFDIKKIEYKLLKRDLIYYNLNKTNYSIFLNNNSYFKELIYQDINYC
ncbi:MAG: hypothetical protein QXU20_04330, partial [Candidatus Woesearchaeota archaeon]